ncbi:interleukin-17 receptor C [Plectropomus leopardus]|uniref:interleukin-17 receptor C n=1 Tax=Plectropomus leopardus TaxID=160734 RepID=UPI001C4B5008|nr:interleukin-17 receptor C [Plectropomus leopardus]
MFLSGWFIFCILLTLRMCACGPEIVRYDSDGVICLQGLSDCTMKDAIPLIVAGNSAVDIQNLTPYFKLCCRDQAPCVLCLVIEAEINIILDKDMEDEGHSGHDEEDYTKEMERNPKASVTVCYGAISCMPTCKKVEFMVNHTALTQQNQPKFSIVISEPAGVSFSSHVMVYSAKQSHLSQEIVAPSLDEVCPKLQERVQECRVPRFSSVINTEMNRVELQFAGRNESLPSVCVQYERNGICQKWNRMTIPLNSVTPCMCLQVWDEDGQRSRRTLSCPFVNTSFLKNNVWQNVSVSLSRGQMHNRQSMLSWNLSAPCRLEGEVWPCVKENSCREMKGFRQQLGSGTWTQNNKGLWEITGVFENIDLQLSPCVMVKVQGMGDDRDPVCFTNSDRHRWSLLVVGVILLLCLTVLIVYLLCDFVKKWVWSCRHGGLVKIGRKGHVVLLSPPDVDDVVSESVCRLGLQLRNQGFSVSVDQWTRKEQCTMGPLPWLHSQLLELNSQGGRVVLALTRKALERAEEWTLRSKEVIKTKGEDRGLPQICSPYSDMFTASLCLIHANKQVGRAGERFLLVNFDSHPTSDRSLPELLQGLPLFQLPSQTQAFLCELTVGGTRTVSGRTWTGWKWNPPDGWRIKTEKGLNKNSHCKYVGDEENLETKPLKRM